MHRPNKIVPDGIMLVLPLLLSTSPSGQGSWRCTMRSLRIPWEGPGAWVQGPGVQGHGSCVGSAGPWRVCSGWIRKGCFGLVANRLAPQMIKLMTICQIHWLLHCKLLTSIHSTSQCAVYQKPNVLFIIKPVFTFIYWLINSNSSLAPQLFFRICALVSNHDQHMLVVGGIAAFNSSNNSIYWLGGLLFASPG